MNNCTRWTEEGIKECDAFEHGNVDVWYLLDQLDAKDKRIAELEAQVDALIVIIGDMP